MLSSYPGWRISPPGLGFNELDSQPQPFSSLEYVTVFFWRITVFSLTMLWIAQVLVAPCHAQRSEGRGRRGSSPNREFYDMLGEAMRNDPHREILDLLLHEAVRQHLQLSEEDYEKLVKIGTNSRDQIWGLRDKTPRLTGEELKNEIVKIMDENGSAAFEALGDEKTKRLEGLYVQQKKTSAAGNPRIAERIGLEGEELDRFQQAHWDLRHRARDEIRPYIERLMQDSNLSLHDRQQKLARLFERSGREIDEALAEKLTEEQRRKLQELMGEPFEDLPPPWMGPGPGRRGPPGASRRGSGRDSEHEGRDAGASDNGCCP